MEAKLLSTDPTTLAVLTLFALLAFTSGFQQKAMDKLLNFDRLVLSSAVGPESLAFDHLGGGPYTGVSDGRIVKWQGQGLGWADFAVHSKYRERVCHGSNDSMLESICGRPLGLQFYKATGDLYVADAYFGLLVVAPNGGVATQLATGADGQPFNLANGLDVDQETGVVYFTDSSTRFRRRDYILAVIMGDATGRLMNYDPKAKKVTVLIRGLAFPNGLAISNDTTFLLIAETGTCRVLKYWLQGPRNGTFEVFAELPGYPDNIKRNPGGEFWVALNQDKVQLNGQTASDFGKTGEPSEHHPVALRLSQEGKVLEVLERRAATSVSEVEERNGTMWLGSVDMPYVGVYTL
ncbi:protein STRICTOSIDINE SYNTHASE-LIKE 10-like [Phoenix dactylifera]|uniref:Protein STRICTOSIDINE SYNTHASE-LIKE 10-like n=1 Tax=Phoenix dactylifera TaxID=42345 RepID=A0A8B7MX80_PHODC|nr:protein STRICTOSIDINE SYNTHASE-LIKE 10-like [Phoenix dactylifera]